MIWCVNLCVSLRVGARIKFVRLLWFGVLTCAADRVSLVSSLPMVGAIVRRIHAPLIFNGFGVAFSVALGCTQKTRLLVAACSWGMGAD